MTSAMALPDSPTEDLSLFSDFPDVNFAHKKPAYTFQRKQKQWRREDSDPAASKSNVSDLLQDLRLPKNRYKYKKINDDHIRLLVIYPPRKNKHDEIECALQPFKFDGPDTDIPPYQALSYYWGEEDPIHKLKLRDISPQEHQDKETTSVLNGQVQAKETTTPLERWKRIARAATETTFGNDFYVRKNLLDALFHLRQPKGTITVWIDALCIDQSNILERNVQVRRMKSLYNKAGNVIIWLGKGNEETKRVMCDDGFIQQIQNPIELDKFGTATGMTDQGGTTLLQNWEDLANLMQSRWFSRRWVVQELALARQATVHCGNDYQNWAVFRDAVASINLKWPQIQEQDLYRRLRHGQDTVGEVKALGASVIVDAISSLFTKTDHQDIIEKLTSLETLVATLQSFESGKPRDLIYSLLSIASDPPESAPVIQADYTKATLDVFSEFLVQSFLTSDSVDMICRHWASRPQKFSGNEEIPRFKKRFKPKERPTVPLPSYMPLAAGAPFGSGQHVLNGRRNGESFVGRPDRRNYHASKKTSPKFGLPKFENTEYEAMFWRSGADGKPGKYVEIENENILPPRYQGILKVKGFLLGSIAEVVGPVAEGTITKECLDLAGWKTEDETGNNIDQDEQALPSKLWRTLVANRDSKGGPVNCLYENACRYCLSHVGTTGHLNTGELIQKQELPQTVKIYLERVREVVWNRKFIRLAMSEELKVMLGTGVTKEGEAWGLGPAIAQKDDLVAIIYGCSVPVVLRPYYGTVGHYTLVGESYIHGFMEGEALTGRDKNKADFKARDKFQDENFELH